MDTDEPNAACAATMDFGLRREAKRHAAIGRNRAARKAVSPLRSATAVQILVAKLQDCISDIETTKHASTDY
jgi:hypothetical protein